MLFWGVVAAISLGRPSGADAQALNACDLNADAVVDILDVQLATNMGLGQVPCTANVIGTGVCNIVLVQRVINAVLSGSCVTGGPHSATLNWTASTSQVVGYNVYRSDTAGGSYRKLNTALVVGTTFIDYLVQAGQTYYYVTTAVDSAGNESGYSNQANATIPTP
jgi:hypothetical protein